MTVGRAGLSPVMVGRGAEIARLRDLVGRHAGTRVALVRGEAGIGKTRLVRELLDGLPADAVGLSAEAEQGPLGRPFHLLLSAVEAAVGDWSAVPAGLAGRGDALAVLLAPVAPGLVSEVRPVTPEELLRAALDLVRYLLGERVGVLVFEDLHWADAESIAVFRRLAVDDRLRLLLVGTYRPEVVEARQLGELIAALDRQQRVEHLELRRLGPSEVAELLAAVYRRPVPAFAAEEFSRRTGGNPFFIEALLVSCGEASPEELPSLPLPANVGEAVLRSLDGLTSAARTVVDAAAVLGQGVPFDLLAVVSGSGEDELLSVLREVVDRGLLVETEPDVFAFRHALVREAVAARLLGRERRRLHEKAHDALRQACSDDWAAIAHHAAGANLWPEMVDAARQGAATYLRCGSTYQALRLAELGLQESDADAELYEIAARAAWSVGLRDSAIAHSEAWLRLVDAVGDDARAARALLVLSRLRWETGDRAAAEQALDRALDRCAGDLPTDVVALVNSQVAELHMLLERRGEALEWADRALAVASPQSLAYAAALTNKGSALLGDSLRYDEATALLLEAAERAEAAGDPLTALRALYNLTHGVLATWPEDRVLALVDRAEVLLARTGRHDWDLAVAIMRAVVNAELLGDLAAALRALDEGYLGFVTGDRHIRDHALLRCMLSIEKGEESAADWLRRAEEQFEVVEGKEGVILRAMQVALACRGEDNKAVPDAIDRLSGVLVANPEDCTASQPTWAWAMREAVRAGVPTDRVREAVALLVRIDPGHGPWADLGWTPHLDAAMREADGDLTGAAEGYEAALDARRRGLVTAVTADVHVGLARCRLGLGNRAAAREHAAQAVLLLERWPGPRQAEAHALLRRLSVSLQRAGETGLTAREREVASLVAEGHSNGEIGRRLYISTKTASVHVSNILAKLGLSGRAEIAAWAVREGVAPPPPAAVG